METNLPSPMTARVYVNSPEGTRGSNSPFSLLRSPMASPIRSHGFLEAGYSEHLRKRVAQSRLLDDELKARTFRLEETVTDNGGYIVVLILHYIYICIFIICM